MNKPVIAPREAFAMNGLMDESMNESRDSSSTAILFGPERAGLTNEDLVYAHQIIEIPTSSENPSLNLAQAVCVVAYEFWVSSRARRGIRQKNNLSAGQRTPDPAIQRDDKLADTPTLQGYFDQLEAALDAKNYFREPHKKPLMWQHLRSLFIKANLTEQEVRTLRGMVRAFERDTLNE
jgi:tRNA/rRNA methyltransferase